MANDKGVLSERDRASGYIDCACRDCFTITIGPVGTICTHCVEAGCDAFYTECRRVDAYGGCEQDDGNP